MLYLISAIIISTSIFITFKFFNRFKIDNFQAITVNYVIASAFGFLIYSGDFTFATILQRTWFPHALIAGVLFICVFLLFALSSQKAGVALTAVSSKMSVIIPVIFGVILYNDSMNFLKIIGILAALIAFYLTLKKNNKIKVYSRYLILPVLLFLGNGITDAFLKYSEHNFISNETVLFLATVFTISLIICIGISTGRYFIFKQKIHIRNIIGGIILGFLNFGTTYYLIMAMGVFQSTVLFPVQNVGIVVLSALAGFIIFREKLSVINWSGILLSIIAILLIAFA